MNHRGYFVFLWLLVKVSAYGQISTTQINCGDASIRFETKCASEQPGILWMHVHENERTAVEAAHAMIDSLQKGCFVTWKSQGNRNVTFQLQGKTYRFDPNRIFTPKGLTATLKANGDFSKAGYKAAQKAADTFIENYTMGKRFVIALHNNSDSGGLHIQSYLKGGIYENDASQVYVSPNQDPDDFFYTTDSVIFTYLKSKDFNILLQNNATVTDDGSFSVYCGIHGIRYLNIEAQAGHLLQQKEMMAAVFRMMEELGL